jgi:hypothetical protein
MLDSSKHSEAQSHGCIYFAAGFLFTEPNPL